MDIKEIKEVLREAFADGGKKDFIEGFVGFGFIFLTVWIFSVIGGA